MEESKEAWAACPRAIEGSTDGMALIEGGSFLMGSEGPEAIPGDGEGPVRRVTISPFWISKTTVNTAEFQAFASASGYVTDAERFGWSFVFRKARLHSFDHTTRFLFMPPLILPSIPQLCTVV